MIFEESLLRAIENQGSIRISTVAFRVTMGGQPPLRANVRGARWNPADTAALYTSLDEPTAHSEWEQILSSQPVRPSGLEVVSEIQVKLQSVVDLSDFGKLRAELDLELLNVPDDVKGYHRCQEVGGAAAFLGRSGIVVPSLRQEGGKNLVIFPTNLLVEVESYEVVPQSE